MGPAFTHQIQIDGMRWTVDAEHPVDCSLPLRFDARQPLVFGAEPASAVPMVSGDFVGSIDRGAAVNVMEVRLNPHCHGTHTESAGHVTRDTLPVARLLDGRPVPAVVRTVRAEPASREGGPANGPGDRIVTAAEIDRVLADAPPALRTGLVLRTAGWTEADAYGDFETRPPPYLTEAAARRLADLGVEHLVVEWPSVDRLHDGGRLAAHRAFWAIEGTRVGRPGATITELAFVPAAAEDGPYLLTLQVPPFHLDAAPSRPILFPLRPAARDLP